MGASKNPYRMMTSWTETVGSMIEADVVARANCSRCSKSVDVDLHRIAADRGPLFSLWGRTSKCTITPGCTGRVWFSAQVRGSGMWPLNMQTTSPSDLEKVTKRWVESRGDLPDQAAELARQLRLVGLPPPERPKPPPAPRSCCPFCQSAFDRVVMREIFVETDDGRLLGTSYDCPRCCASLTIKLRPGRAPPIDLSELASDDLAGHGAGRR